VTGSHRPGGLRQFETGYRLTVIPIPNKNLYEKFVYCYDSLEEHDLPSFPSNRFEGCVSWRQLLSNFKFVKRRAFIGKFLISFSAGLTLNMSGKYYLQQ